MKTFIIFFILVALQYNIYNNSFCVSGISDIVYIYVSIVSVLIFVRLLFKTTLTDKIIYLSLLATAPVWALELLRVVSEILENSPLSKFF